MWTTLSEITSIIGDGLHGTPQYDIFGNYFFINGNNLINRTIVIKEETKKLFGITEEDMKNRNMYVVCEPYTNVRFPNREKQVLSDILRTTKDKNFKFVGKKIVDKKFNPVNFNSVNEENESSETLILVVYKNDFGDYIIRVFV